MKSFLAILILAAGALPASGQTAEGEIRHLLQFVRESQAEFLRNGEAYPPEEAAAHLQRKQDHNRNRISTAEDFIRLAGTKSLFTGDDYRVRLNDGTTMISRDWLMAELDRHRAGTPALNPHPPDP